MANNIRPATAADAKNIAPLLIQAMGKLADRFSNNAPFNEQLALFEQFVRLPDNQYSFENTLVYEANSIILGMSNGYDGGRLQVLRYSFLEYIKTRFAVIFKPIEDETEAGEFYLDCVSVAGAAQGRGLGTELLQVMLERGKRLCFPKAGLLVDADNLQAKKLYLKLGFEIIKPKTFMGGSYFHMQYVY